MNRHRFSRRRAHAGTGLAAVLPSGFVPFTASLATAVWKNGEIMIDPKKSAEAARKIQEISRTITNHQSRITQLEREKNDRVRYYDQQIKHEQDEIKRHSRSIDELKRQI